MAHSAPLPVDDEARIKELAPLARKARRQHQPDDPKVLASQELTLLFKLLHKEQHCSIASLAKAADMSYHSVSARIKKED